MQNTNKILYGVIDVITFITCLIGAGIFSIHLGIDSNYDLKNYHLYNAYSSLNSRFLYDILPAQIQTFLNPFFNYSLLWFLNLFNKKPVLYCFFSGLSSGLICYFIFRLYVKIFREFSDDEFKIHTYAIICVIISATGSMFVSLIGTTTNDMIASLLCLITLSILINDLSIKENIKCSIRSMVAGLIAGVVVGGKLTSAIYILPIDLLVMLFFSFRYTIRFAVWQFLGFVIVFGPFGFKLWRITGNPLFPFYNTVFHSPAWLDVNIRDIRFLPTSTLEYIIYPFTWAIPQNHVTELYMQDLRLTICYLSLLVIFIFSITFIFKCIYDKAPRLIKHKFQQFKKTIFLSLFFLLSYLIWVSYFGIYRYLLLDEILSSSVIAISIILFLDYKNNYRGTVLLISLAIMMNIFIVRPNWGRTPIIGSVIDVEPIPVESNSLVIFADDKPHSYLVPFFPPGARVVSINNNLVKPDEVHGLNMIIKSLIEAHYGNISVVYSFDTQEAFIINNLLKYNIKIGSCVLVKSNIEVNGHYFCKGSKLGSS